jgi:hypothetical protein
VGEAWDEVSSAALALSIVAVSFTAINAIGLTAVIAVLNRRLK